MSFFTSRFKQKLRARRSFVFAAGLVLLLGFGSPILLISGFIFGKWFGFIYAVLGLSIGATLLYMFANYFFKNLIEEKFSKRFSYLTEKFKKNEFLIMLIWGIFQELLVEYLFNGRVWIYEPLPWNPVIIPALPGSATLCPGYTLIPQAIWVVAPIIFYLVCLKVFQKTKID